MTFAGITLKVMPESTDIDFDELERKIKQKILEIYGDVGEIRLEEEPIAFGLRALKFTFVIDEKLGADPIEQAVGEMEGVASARIVDFRRAIG